MLKPALDTDQAAAVIGCAKQTLIKSRSTGTLFNQPTPPYRKMGSRVVYDQDALQKWIDEYPVGESQ